MVLSDGRAKMAVPTGHAGKGTALVDHQECNRVRCIAQGAGVCVMTIDDRFQRQWCRTRARCQMVRSVAGLLHTYGQRDGETEAAFQARLALQNDTYAQAMDARELAANDYNEPAFE
jgi:hypothetical protein